MYKKVKTLINGLAIELFFAMLYENGVRIVNEYTSKSTSFKKHYGFFIVDKNAQKWYN